MLFILKHGSEWDLRYRIDSSQNFSVFPISSKKYIQDKQSSLHPDTRSKPILFAKVFTIYI